MYCITHSVVEIRKDASLAVASVFPLFIHDLRTKRTVTNSTGNLRDLTANRCKNVLIEPITKPRKQSLIAKQILFQRTADVFIEPVLGILPFGTNGRLHGTEQTGKVFTFLLHEFSSIFAVDDAEHHGVNCTQTCLNKFKGSLGDSFPNLGELRTDASLLLNVGTSLINESLTLFDKLALVLDTSRFTVSPLLSIDLSSRGIGVDDEVLKVTRIVALFDELPLLTGVFLFLLGLFLTLLVLQGLCPDTYHTIGFRDTIRRDLIEQLLACRIQNRTITSTADRTTHDVGIGDDTALQDGYDVRTSVGERTYAKTSGSVVLLHQTLFISRKNAITTTSCGTFQIVLQIPVEHTGEGHLQTVLRQLVVEVNVCSGTSSTSPVDVSAHGHDLSTRVIGCRIILNHGPEHTLDNGVVQLFAAGSTFHQPVKFDVIHCIRSIPQELFLILERVDKDISLCLMLHPLIQIVTEVAIHVCIYEMHGGCTAFHLSVTFAHTASQVVCVVGLTPNDFRNT